MVIQSRFSVDIPNCSIQQWIFGSCSDPIPNGDQKAWIDAEQPDTRYLTYHSARLLAKRIAVGLLDNGLQPGDRVLLFAGNSVVFPAVMLGIWMAGGVFTGSNPAYVVRELSHQLKNTEARFMLAAGSSWEVAIEAAKVAGLPADGIFVIDDTIPDLEAIRPDRGQQHWTKLVASKEKGEAFQWVEPIDPKNTTCTLNFSSGTTGLPKGVEITHHNHVANGYGVVGLNKLSPDYEERRRRGATLCFLPMYHAFSQGYFISCFPYERIPVYVMPGFDLVKMLRNIKRFRITKLLAVPPILVVMTKHPLAKKADLSSLEMVGSGAAPLAADTAKEVSKMLTGTNEPYIRQGWGMTELTCTGLGWDITTPLSEKSVGELMPGCKAKLIDRDSGKEITKAETRGELYISGPTLMRAYWRNPTATQEAILTDSTGTRWLRTGDVAYVTPDYAPGALFHIVDRAKELIKVRGFQVAPAELDALLLEREDVLDAAVVGVTIAGEEVPRAYIVPKPGSAPATAAEVQNWVKDRVAYYKRLKGGVVFVDTIPKNPSGKILRKVLRERAKQEVENSSARL